MSNKNQQSRAFEAPFKKLVALPPSPDGLQLPSFEYVNDGQRFTVTVRDRSLSTAAQHRSDRIQSYVDSALFSLMLTSARGGTSFPEDVGSKGAYSLGDRTIDSRKFNSQSGLDIIIDLDDESDDKRASGSMIYMKVDPPLLKSTPHLYTTATGVDSAEAIVKVGTVGQQIDLTGQPATGGFKWPLKQAICLQTATNEPDPRPAVLSDVTVVRLTNTSQNADPATYDELSTVWKLV